MDIEFLLKQTSHRPFPLPKAPWIMLQHWHDLLFAHWPLPPDLLAPRVPKQFVLDTYDGSAWLGITPFEMRNTRFRLLPPIPTATTFGEVNVRTYVRYQDKPGVYFFSLDASSSLAVLGARAGISLPYHRADTRTTASADGYLFSSRRRGSGGPGASLDVTYKPVSPVRESQPGSLEAWLTERYCLFTMLWGMPAEVDIHHLKWPLQSAEADFRDNTMTAPLQLPLPEDQAPLLHFSDYLKVLVWPAKRARPLG
jgi:uncharacterized protein